MIVHMIGNAHIDPVWLWNWQAGVDEALATFRSAIDRCEEYPEFIFTRGEAWLYQQIERIDLAMFERVRQLIAKGQWHITGGQYIQPDVNLPTYEGLRRQIHHGRQYFQDRFGIAPDVAYNVDSFGHPATFPDLLASEGYLGYVFHRPSQQQTPVPSCTFRWRGVGGGEIIGFRIPAPYVTRTDDLYGQIMLSLDAADPALGHVMCFYGVGNHGGGPTKGNIEYILANRNAFAGAELRFSTPQAFFREVDKQRDKLPVVDIELQKTFPGCYVVMQDIKRAQRRGEHQLQQTAVAIDAWADQAEQAGLNQKLDVAWEDLLFTEFHDILAGTSIAAAWESVRAMQGRARILAEELMVDVTRGWSREHLPPVNHQQIAVMNPSVDEFDGFVAHDPFLDFAGWDSRWLADPTGNPIPFQFVQASSTIMMTPGILFPAKVRAGGSAVLVLRDDPPPADTPIANTLRVDEATLANERVTMQFGPGGIRQILFDGHPLLGERGLGLRLRQDTADTWGFHIDRFAEEITDTLAKCEWIVEERGPLRARVRTESTIGRSPVRITVSLYHDRPEIDLQMEFQFIERYRLLQMPVELATKPTTWRCGLAGGAVSREPSPVEWPLQGWTSTDRLAICCHDANSISLDGNTLTWSLLRSTRMAWSGHEGSIYSGRDDFTDQGTHRFHFTLLPLAAPLSDAELRQRADRLVQPLLVFDRYEGLDRPPWGGHPPRRLWTPAEHRARRDGRLADLTDDGGPAVVE